MVPALLYQQKRNHTTAMKTKTSVVQRQLLLSDDELITRIKAGDEKACTILFARHERLLRFVLKRYLQDDQAIDEVVQDTFLRAFRNLYQFRGESKLSTWLSRIAISQALTFLRRRRNARWLPIDNYRSPQDAGEWYSDSDIERSDLQRQIQEIISNLSPKDATAIELFYLKEQSIEEIRQITGWTASNIKSRLSRTRQHLRETLAGSAMQTAYFS